MSAEDGKTKPTADTGYCSYSDKYKLYHSIKNVGRRDCGCRDKHDMQAPKKSVHIGERIDKSAPKVVCIDDFATKKRHTYGTVMVDVGTGRIIDMLESRESTEVSSWPRIPT